MVGLRRVGGLADGSHSPVLYIIFRYKTGNYHMQARFGQAGIDRDSFMGLRRMDLAYQTLSNLLAIK